MILTSTEAIRLIRDGGKEVWKLGGEGDYIPIVTLSPQNDSCIKMGSGESHFNVS